MRNAQFNRLIKGYGVIDASGFYSLRMENASYPTTLTLKSSHASRKIELSFDDGATFATPAAGYDHVDASQIVLVLNAPVTDVKFTGTTNDEWRAL